MNFLYLIIFLLITQMSAISVPVAGIIEGFAEIARTSVGVKSPNDYNNSANPMVPGPDVISDSACPVCSNQSPYKSGIQYRTPMSF